MSTDSIEKRVEIDAPVSRVWHALTDFHKFGEWFGVKLDRPFVPGQTVAGPITHPGYEHVVFEAKIQQMEPERLFSFTWAHPKSLAKGEYPADRSGEPSTLVEFRLEPAGAGTLLIVTESGFDKLPADRRLEAFRRNEGGWAQQMINIKNYAAEKP